MPIDASTDERRIDYFYVAVAGAASGAAFSVIAYAQGNIGLSAFCAAYSVVFSVSAFRQAARSVTKKIEKLVLEEADFLRWQVDRIPGVVELRLPSILIEEMQAPQPSPDAPMEPNHGPSPAG